MMTTDVVTVGRDGTLADAAEALLANDVGSVIVVDDDGTPGAILSEADLIRAGYETGQPFVEVPVDGIGHRPVVTIEPTASVSLLAERMEREGVKKVPVMDDLDLVGIVTLSDVVWHLSDIRREAGELASARERWESEKK